MCRIPIQDRYHIIGDPNLLDIPAGIGCGNLEPGVGVVGRERPIVVVKFRNRDFEGTYQVQALGHLGTDYIVLFLNRNTLVLSAVFGCSRELSCGLP